MLNNWWMVVTNRLDAHTNSSIQSNVMICEVFVTKSLCSHAISIRCGFNVFFLVLTMTLSPTNYKQTIYRWITVTIDKPATLLFTWTNFSESISRLECMQRSNWTNNFNWTIKLKSERHSGNMFEVFPLNVNWIGLNWEYFDGNFSKYSYEETIREKLRWIIEDVKVISNGDWLIFFTKEILFKCW